MYFVLMFIVYCSLFIVYCLLFIVYDNGLTSARFFQLNFPSGTQILRAKTLAKKGGRVQGVFWLLSREENYSNRFLFLHFVLMFTVHLEQ